LHLSRNKLSGSIPPAIGELPDILDLALAGNQLSGEIPSEMNNLNLTALNLLSNQLTGRIPSNYNNLAYENSFLENSNLCAVNSPEEPSRLQKPRRQPRQIRQQAFVQVSRHDSRTGSNRLPLRYSSQPSGRKQPPERVVQRVESRGC
ncbi:LRR receptor-like serine/threonine-protein kinase HSL2, partial [Linum perenne]